MTKNCPRCHEVREFGPNRTRANGLQGYCRVCMREIVRARGAVSRARRHARELEDPALRRAATECIYRWNKRNPQKKRVHGLVFRAIARGELTVPETCADCNAKGKVHAHHEDYDKPLDIVWLCTRCHGKRHRIAA